MCTSLVLFALSVFAPSAVTEPVWLNDYSLALKKGQNENKPLAVFIGSGKNGWDKVSKDGSLAKEVRQVLAENYVCVYLDLKENEGWRLAYAFEITEGSGLVISNRKGHLQAFRHQGDLEKSDLERYLRRYADPNREVRQTESTNRVSNYYNPESGNAQPSYFGRSC